MEPCFREFATGRAPLLAAMLATTDATARRAAATALREYDEPRLGGLRSIQQELGGVWDIDEADARDAVLAAL